MCFLLVVLRCLYGRMCETCGDVAFIKSPLCRFIICCCLCGEYRLFVYLAGLGGGNVRGISFCECVRGDRNLFFFFIFHFFVFGCFIFLIVLSFVCVFCWLQKYTSNHQTTKTYAIIRLKVIIIIN